MTRLATPCRAENFCGRDDRPTDAKGYLHAVGPAPLRYQSPPAPVLYAMAKTFASKPGASESTNSSKMTDKSPGVPPASKEEITTHAASGQQGPKYLIKPLHVNILNTDVSVLDEQAAPSPQPQVVSPQMLLKFFNKSPAGADTNHISVITPLELKPTTPPPPTRDSRATYSTGP